MRCLRRLAFLLACLLGAPALSAQNAPPIALQFQARLSDATGAPITTSVALTARVYDVPVGGTALWSQTFNVTPLDGVVTLSFDALGPILNVLFASGTRFLALQVNADAEMTPRRQIFSVPYARSAAKAAALDANAAIPTGLITTTQILDGSIAAADLADATVTGTKIAGGTITAANLAPGAISAGSIAPSAIGSAAIADGAITLADLAHPLTTAASGVALDVEVSNVGATAIRGAATASTGASTGVLGESASSAGFGVLGRATSLGGIGVLGEGFGDAFAGAAVKGTLTTASPAPFGTGVLGEITATGGLGVGVTGTHAGAGIGVFGTTVSGRGVYGRANGASGNSIGALGETFSSTGTGVFGAALSVSGANFGVVGSTNSGSGRGVWGKNLATSGSARGVVGEINSTLGFGVLGTGNSASASDTTGVVGESNAGVGSGVFGHALKTTGPCAGVSGRTESTTGFGVKGTVSPTTGVNFGVHGTSLSSSGFGVFSDGRFGATGSKSFIQPHPTDASKEVHFVCLEGNESGTYFRGSSKLVDGVAAIEVPEEFRLVSELDGVTAQVTPIGAPAALWIESKSLDRIVVRGEGAASFDYFVNGVRRGFREHRAIHENHAYVPKVRGVPYGTQYPEALRRVLVENGILNADFTPNEATAAARGWTLRDAAEAPTSESSISVEAAATGGAR